MKGIIITRSRLVAAIREWKEEWDNTPNQFLIGEAFRQADPESYAEQAADHLLSKLITNNPTK
jgi:hypothetical protein